MKLDAAGSRRSGYGAGMPDYAKVGLVLITVLLVAGGIFLYIYLTQGGEGDSTNIPGNPSEVVRLPLG